MIQSKQTNRLSSIFYISQRFLGALLVGATILLSGCGKTVDIQPEIEEINKNLRQINRTLKEIKDPGQAKQLSRRLDRILKEMRDTIAATEEKLEGATSTSSDPKMFEETKKLAKLADREARDLITRVPAAQEPLSRTLGDLEQALNEYSKLGQ